MSYTGKDDKRGIYLKTFSYQPYHSPKNMTDTPYFFFAGIVI